MPDAREYSVEAHLRLVEACDEVDYNVRAPGGGLEGLREIDVIGLNFATDSAFICEVVTHTSGTLYRNHNTTVQRVTDKHTWARRYAESRLARFPNQQFQFWAPYVTPKLADSLQRIDPSLTLVINEDYRSRVEVLMAAAWDHPEDIGNPFPGRFRLSSISAGRKIAGDLGHGRKERPDDWRRALV